MATTSHTETNPAVRALPIISIGARSRDVNPAKDDESLRPVSGPGGFALDAEPVDHRVPWEQRPLSRRGILGWTVASMVGAFLFVATLAVAISRHAAHQGQSAAVAQDTLAVPAAPPVTSASAEHTPIVPLEALPRADAPAQANTPARRSRPAAHHAVAHSSLARRAPRLTTLGSQHGTRHPTALPSKPSSTQPSSR